MEWQEPKEFGTLYDTFRRTVARWGDRAAYAVPPMAGRAYHPEGKEYTWSETAAAVEVMRRRYAAAGYGLGHRVAILFDQRPEFLFHYFALNALGCCTVPVNPDYRQDEIRYLMENSDACLAVVIDSRRADLDAVAALLPGRFAVVSFERIPETLPAAPTPAAAGKPDHTTEAALLYTSGTTGRPKGCILSNEYFHTFALSYITCGGPLQMHEGVERMYNPLPLHHANCLSISVPTMLILGGCLVFPDRYHSSTWWQDLVQCRITCVQMQGIIPNVLLKMAPSGLERKHQVRFALCAGVEPIQHEPFEKRFGMALVEMWAMTETGRLISDCVEPRSIHTRAFGRPGRWVEARIVDENDNELPPNQPGQFVIRANAASPRQGFFSGYLKNEEATEEAWRNGWFHTGDVAMRDDSGMFYFVDRSKNIIRRSGENIAAAEIEACLAAHDGIKQIAVVGVVDEVRDEEVLACVVARSPEAAGPELAQEILKWSLERMAYFKAPAWYLFVPSLPTGTSQKIVKTNLFPKDVDPRTLPGAIDLRGLKKKPPQTSAAQAGGERA